MPALDIAALRLRNQRISWTDFTRPEEVVDWLVAVQSQDYPAAKWALGTRLPDAIEDQVEEAFNRGLILRTHVLRPTWHFVTPADIRWLLGLTATRVQAANAGMYRRLGLDEDTLRRANKEIERGFAGRKELTRAEVREVLKTAGFMLDSPLKLGYFLMHAELDGIICSGPRQGREFTYALLEERAPIARILARDEALATLANAYFRSRGPASAADFAKWAGLTLTDARRGLEEVKSQFDHETVSGKEYWFSPFVAFAEEANPRAHLLSVNDEFVSSYKDHSPIAGEAFRRKLRTLGSALTNIVVLNGRVAGIYRRELHPRIVVIRATYFRRLSEAELEAVEDAARRYGHFLDLPVEIISTFEEME
jgi:hypothetical protein